MYRDSGIVLKTISYSDSASIVRCFTHEKGVTALFARHSKKSKHAAHLQTGAFMEFTAQPKPGALASIRESRWNRNVPNTPLPPTALATWLFTVELLHRSLAEHFALPHLKVQVERYYAHLLHEAVSPDPCTPLIVISTALGIFNQADFARPASPHLAEDLERLGYHLPVGKTAAVINDPETLFDSTLGRFMQHFGIQRLESRELL